MHTLEFLERRALLSVSFANGVLTITGTPGYDSFYVTIGTGQRLNVLDSGVQVASHPASQVKKIVFAGGEGNDAISINGALGAIPSRLDGGNGDDQLGGGSGNDSILGGAGRDQLTGNDGNDSLDAGDGDDNLAGAKGNDTLLGGAGRDLMVGGEGNDFLDGGFDADTFRGGIGIDTASYATRTKPVFVDITGTPSETPDDGEAGEKDTVEFDIENVIGGAGNDLLIGTTVSADKLTTPGFTRNNVLRGNGGNDTLRGLDGNDVLDGGLGADVLTGGAGIDTADYATRTQNLTLNLDGAANDGAPNEKDRIDMDIENLTGGSGHDRMTGNGGANVLLGNAGNDTLDGGLGKDVMLGGAGIDTVSYASRSQNLFLNLDGLANDGAAGELDRIGSDIENLTGGSGADTITGNAARNILGGGAGNDVIFRRRG
jgi:Ca2+-binding RTX toxin-like protein